MARERSVLDDCDSPESDDESPISGGNTSLLHRRGYLKLAGSAAAVTAGAAAAGTGAAAGDYDVIELGAGERRVIRIDSGETFENKLIDCTANGAKPVIIAKGTNWTIRNVGIHGYLDVGTPDCVFGVADTGGNTSTIENVYLGDGAANAGKPTAETAIWVDPAHSGHLDIRRANIQGFSDNAIYASSPGGSGGGTIHVDECFAANCRTSHYRIGSTGSKVTNSSVLLTNDGYDGRGVWVWKPGPCTVENCQLEMNGRHYSIRAGAHSGPTTVRLSNTEYDTGYNGGTSTRGGSTIDSRGGNGTSPDAFVPEGVPESAETAASGGPSSQPSADQSDDSDTESDDELENVVLVDGTGTDGSTRYEFTVSGAAERSTDGGASIDGEDTIEDGTVSGTVAGWRDAFRFAGDVEELWVDGPATVSVNGERVDPADYGQTHPKTLTIVGNGQPASYDVSVDGSLELQSDDSDSDATVVSGGTAQGTVESGVDRFAFSGSITDFTFVDGTAHVYVDDERVDPAEYGSDVDLPHAIVIDGSDTSEPSTYSFTIDGDVAPADYRSASFNDDDVIENGTVRGVVSSWRDAYWFSGSIEDFTILGEANVDVQLNARER